MTIHIINIGLLLLLSCLAFIRSTAWCLLCGHQPRRTDMLTALSAACLFVEYITWLDMRYYATANDIQNIFYTTINYVLVITLLYHSGRRRS